MQKIVVKDPYCGNYVVEIEDDIPQEVLDEVVAFMDSNCREIWAKDRYESRHASFSLDAVDYEGKDYADTDTPESVLIRRENAVEDDETKLNRYLSALTETQQNRIRMRWKGLSFKQIADIEGKDSSTIRESIYAVEKKLKKKFPDKF